MTDEEIREIPCVGENVPYLKRVILDLRRQLADSERDRAKAVARVEELERQLYAETGDE